MEPLDPDLTFTSSEMESLHDFTTEEECSSSSCLLQILPSDASYNQTGIDHLHQTGIDLNEYAETLSSGISLTGLGVGDTNVLGAETTVTESLIEETTVDALQTEIITEIDDHCQTQPADSISEHSRGLLDVPPFYTDIPQSTVIDQQTNKVTLEEGLGQVENTIQIGGEPYVLANEPQDQGDQQLFSTTENASSSSDQVLIQPSTKQNLGSHTDNILQATDEPNSKEQIIVPPVRMPSFAYITHGVNSLSTVAPNVFLTSINQRKKVNNFSNSRKRSAKTQPQKKPPKRLLAPTITAAATAQPNSKPTVTIPAQTLQQLTDAASSNLDLRQIKVELTQVSNDTTIVRLSLIPEAGTNVRSSTYLTPTIVSKVHPSLVTNKDPAAAHTDNSINQEEGLECSTESQIAIEETQIEGNIQVIASEQELQSTSGSARTVHNFNGKDNEITNNTAEKTPLDQEVAIIEEVQPQQGEFDNPGNILTDQHVDEEEQLNESVEIHEEDNDSRNTNLQIMQGNQTINLQANWDEMSLETAEAEMASLLAESRLKMKTLAKLDEITIHITDAQCRTVGSGKKRWFCNQCEKSYTTKNNLVVHTLRHNGIKPHVCMVCQRMFSQQSHLKTHMLTHGNIRPHACKVCNRTFTQLSHVKRHMATHMDSWPYRCDICQRGFAYPSELKSHSEKHRRAKDHKCPECEAHFDQAKKLAFHMRTSHKDPEELTCGECGKQFMYPSQLKEHLVKHSGHRPYNCEQCGMNFMKEHHLKAHIYTHSGVKPFQCMLCHRTFNQKANMLRHMLIHSDERHFECDICHKNFSQLQTLKAHKVVHSKKKPFQCSLCGKQFGRLHTLQGHMHIHQNSKPHICFCGATFTLRGNLTRHQKVKHGITTQPSHSTEEEAANILKAMSSGKRSANGAGSDPPSPTTCSANRVGNNPPSPTTHSVNRMGNDPLRPTARSANGMTNDPPNSTTCSANSVENDAPSPKKVSSSIVVQTVSEGLSLINESQLDPQEQTKYIQMESAREHQVENQKGIEMHLIAQADGEDKSSNSQMVHSTNQLEPSESDVMTYCNIGEKGNVIIADVSPLVANFHSYCVKSKAVEIVQENSIPQT